MALSTRPHSYDVKIWMKNKFDLTKRKYISMREGELQALYKRFTFEKPGISYEKFITVLENSYK